MMREGAPQKATMFFSHLHWDHVQGFPFFTPAYLPTTSLTLYGPDDIRLRRTQIDEGLADPARKSADHARLNALLGLAEATGCRRRKLLAYFGEDLAEDCGNCDICQTPPKLFDATQAVRKALALSDHIPVMLGWAANTGARNGRRSSGR